MHLSLPNSASKHCFAYTFIIDISFCKVKQRANNIAAIEFGPTPKRAFIEIFGTE